MVRQPHGDITFINISLLSFYILPASPSSPFNYILLIFPIQMHWRPMLTLPSNRSRSSQCHDLYTNFEELYSLKLSANFQNHRPSGSGENDFKGFCYLTPWRPSWSCDLEHLYELSFPLPKDAWHTTVYTLTL